jgi:ThiF family
MTSSSSRIVVKSTPTRNAQARVLHLSPNVHLVERDDAVALVTEDDALTIEPAGAAMRTALAGLRDGCREEWLADRLGPRLAGSLVSALRDHRLLLDAPVSLRPTSTVDRQAGWLALHAANVADAHRRLAEAHVAIVGVGGVGGVLLQHLAGAGVRRFSLLDPDTVAPGDLNRQYLFRPSDVGRPKVEAAAEAIDGATVRGWQLAVRASDDLDILLPQLPDLLVLAADSPLDALETAAASFTARAGVALTMAAVGLERGYWGPTLVPSTTACLSCWRTGATAGLDSFQADIAGRPGAPTPFSFGPVNSLVASLLARDAVLLLIGSPNAHSMGARVVVKAHRLQFAVRGCAACSCWSKGAAGE